MPSDAQIKTIKSMLHQLPDAEAADLCENWGLFIRMAQDGPHYVIEDGTLSKSEASACIDDIKTAIAAHKDAPAPKGAVEMADPRVPEVTEEELQMEKWRLTGAGCTTPEELPPDIKTAGDLFTYCWKEYQMQRGEVFNLLGVEKVAEIVNPAAALKIVRHAKAKTAEPEQPALIEEE